MIKAQQLVIDTLEFSVYDNGVYDSILLPNLQQYNPVIVSNGLKIDLPPRMTVNSDFPLQFHLDTNLLINYDSIKVRTLPLYFGTVAVGKAHINSLDYTVPSYLLPDSMLSMHYYTSDTIRPAASLITWPFMMTICQNCSSVQLDSNFTYDLRMDNWIIPYITDEEKCFIYSGSFCNFSNPFNYNTYLDSTYYFDITPSLTAQMIQEDFCKAISNKVMDPLYSSDIYFDCIQETAPATLNNMFISLVFKQKLYLYAYRTCIPTTSSLSINTCDSYTSPSGKYVWTSSNTYMDTIPNTANCDSIITINLTLNKVDSTVTQVGNLLTADESGATYQWLDCPAMTTVSGANGQSYTATANGDYAVIVINNGCSDTSACYAITSVGLVENDFGNELLVFPNPTDGNFSIDLGGNYNSVMIIITDVDGRVIQSNNYHDSQLLNLKLEEPSGIYILMVKSGNKKAVIRLVKE